LDSELQRLANTLKNAKCPEDVFGILAGTMEDKLRKCQDSFRYLVKLSHPDHFTADDDKKVATEAFKLLNPLYEQAQRKIKDNTYGDNKPVKDAPIPTPAPAASGNIEIKTKKATYTLKKILWTGSISDVFELTDKEVMKISRVPADNDLINAEAKALKELHKDVTPAPQNLPELMDSFLLPDPINRIARQANVLTYNPKLVSVEQVISAYPKGIDARDMAWMFRRVLAATWYAHQHEIVHGAVLPPHILLNLETHGIILWDWCFSVKFDNSNLKAVDAKYGAYYPKSVFDKKPATVALDIYMAATTMIKLLGGDPATKNIPISVPKEIRQILRACTMDPSGFDDAKEIHDEFTATIGKLFGPPEFREFKLK
jgi:hypothetical protein